MARRRDLAEIFRMCAPSFTPSIIIIEWIWPVIIAGLHSDMVAIVDSKFNMTFKNDKFQTLLVLTINTINATTK
jgi:hypothetical protein